MKEGGYASRFVDYWTRTNTFRGQDPHVTQIGESSFLLPQSARDDTVITARVFKSPEGMLKAKPVTLWTPDKKSDHSREIWAPKLFRTPDAETWDLLYSASDGKNENHRTYRLRSQTSDPLGKYVELGQVLDPQNNHWAIDLTEFEHEGKRYAIYSGVEGKKRSLLPQNLYIAEVLDPLTLGKRHLLSTPTYSWEQTVEPINEGAAVLQHAGDLFVVKSTDASWTSAYKLGLLQLKKGGNPLNQDGWINHPEPVLEGKGRGHPSFITMPTGEEIIIYHEKLREEPGWRDRVVKYRQFHYDAETGLPVFGKKRKADIVPISRASSTTVGFGAQQVA